ncbi:MAG: fatty acid CoA ligase family protein [Gammaproteobacteria bacterium]
MTGFRKSYYHQGGTEPLLGATIPEHFQSIVEKFAERPAVIARPQQRRLTYQQLAEGMDRLALGIHALGYARGDRIGIWASNNVEWILVQMATARLGVILVNINPAYRPRELAYALRHSEVQGLFVIPNFFGSRYPDMLAELIPDIKQNRTKKLHDPEFPALRHVIVYQPVNPEQTSCEYPGLLTWQQVLAQGAGLDREILEKISYLLDRDDPINIQYTSGTTGFPKAVLLSHHNILNNAYFSALAMHLCEEDRLCIPVPFYHCFGMVLSTLLCFSVGACAVIPCETFDAEQVLETIALERCTALHGVPTMFIAELEHPRFPEFDLSTLRTGIMAGAPCPPALMIRVMEELHCPEILIGYGQTEASPLTHLTNRDDSLERRTESVGRNLPHQEVKIVSTQRNETVALGETGEICFRGYHVMRGYFRESEKTAEVLDEAGWLHSGDLGYIDDQGYLSITGRLRDMIIRGGENIYPREIEDYLFSHPKVAEVAVFGIPSDYYGEEVVAWVRLHNGQTATQREIQAYCEDGLAHFKIPKIIRFVNDFPMTVTGKIQKFKMREIMLDEISRQPNRRL